MPSPSKNYEKLQAPTSHVFTTTKLRAKSKQPVSVTLETAGQCTIKWNDLDFFVEDGKSVKIAGGECNMYLFPGATIDGQPVKLMGEQLQALTEVLVALATDSTNDMMLTPDVVGAYPIHALLVANTEQSLLLAMRLFKAEPGLMLQTHAPGPFYGENCMHCIAVNSHEDELCEMLALASKKLPKDSVEILLTAQTEGAFFMAAPMNFYGGTPLSYASVFGLKRAVKMMLDTGLVTLDSPAARCEVSGFLPVHTCTANGLKDMFDWLTTGVARKPGEPTLAPEQLANAKSIVIEGRLPEQQLVSCSPMQLAAQLGSKKMFIFMLRKQTNVLWKWGPVTAYEINLDGVDSAGDAECDVMEIIGRLDCPKETTEMLLDSFMQGFIHDLFVQKWHRYGKWIHYFKIFLHVVYTGSLANIAFGLKAHPEQMRHDVFWPCFVIAMLVLLLEEELRTFYLWWNNEGASRPFRKKLWAGVNWLSSFQVDLQLVGYACATLAVALLVLDSHELTHGDGDGDGDGDGEEGLGGEGRLLRKLAHSGLAHGGGEAAWGGEDSEEAQLELVRASELNDYGHDGNHALVLLLLALGLSSNVLWLTYNILTPFEKLGVFMLTVNRMLRNDIVIFMVLFMLFIGNFYCLLYVVYPRAGDSLLPEAAQFNGWADALQAMATLAFLGEPIDLELSKEQLSLLSGWQQVDMAVFLLFYVVYILMSIILLLNLLIALLGNTFMTTYNAASLEWRLMFARYLLRLELIARPLHIWDLRVGEKQSDSKYVFQFRDVAANSEGGGASGNPFEDTDTLDEASEHRAERKRDEHTEKLLEKVDAALAGRSGVGGGSSDPTVHAKLSELQAQVKGLTEAVLRMSAGPPPRGAL